MLTPWVDALIGDEEIAGAFSAEADLAAMLRFEAELAKVQSALALVPATAAQHIADTCQSFTPDQARLCEAMRVDGVVVPELVRQLRAAVGAEAAPYVHKGATSQDVVDTSLALRLGPVLDLFEQRLDRIVDTLTSLDLRYGKHTLTGRTRMQAALPIQVSDRLRSWRDPLIRIRGALPTLRPDLLRVQFGGPVGTRNGLDGQGDEVARALAEALGLYPANQAWHTDRHGLVEFADVLSHITGVMGKLGQDIALMAQNGIDTVSLSGTGASSAMAHKRNPVKAELLVTLARYNSVQLSAMHLALVHEQERSGTAWTLEWLVLPTMVRTAGASCLLAKDLLDSVERLGEEQ